MLHYVQAEVHWEQVPLDSQSHRFQELSLLGSYSSAHPPLCNNLLHLPHGFLRWELVPTSIGLTQLTALLPIMSAPQWINPITYHMGYPSTLAYSHLPFIFRFLC